MIRVSSKFYKVENFNDFMFAFLEPSQALFENVYSKRKEFAPPGSKFFPFRVDHFSEGRKTIFRVPASESIAIPLTCHLLILVSWEKLSAEILKFFFIFPRKQGLILHTNYHLRR